MQTCPRSRLTSLLDLPGQPVTLSASVDEIVSDRAFVAGGALVVLEEGVTFDPIDDALIRAEGTAGAVTDADGIEPAATALEALSPGEREEYEGYPLLASSAEIVP